MAKRPAVEAPEHGRERLHIKRRKSNEAPNHSSRDSITSAGQLHDLIAFQQNVPKLKSGIQAFKLFLESILYPDENSNVSELRSLLQEFLLSQKVRNHVEHDAVRLDLLQTWSFANQTNDDSLLSAVTAVIALLLRTISTQIELRDYGLSLCKTILNRDHVKLISRGLSTQKHKDYVISPSLRLLTEIVSFDGGAVAGKVYSMRDFTLDNKTLVRNLGLRRDAADGIIEDRRKQSVRSNAVRFLLANLRYQEESAKIDILRQANVFRALLSGVSRDPPGLAHEIIQALDVYVIQDKSLPRRSKNNVFTERNLIDFLSLLRTHQPQEDASKPTTGLRETTHALLTRVCTSLENGVLLPQSGWYPPGTDHEKAVSETNENSKPAIDVGLASLYRDNTYENKVSVRNTILGGFVQSFKPYASLFECDLLLDIFKAAPELVADYFFKKSSFSFDPKLTTTWIGYASYLYSVIKLSIPHEFGLREGHASIPPPISIVIESILPQPLNRKTQTRCLNQSSSLVRLFALRLLLVAFEKMERVLLAFSTAAKETHNALWKQAASSLVLEFENRCPKMKDVVTAFRSMSKAPELQREAVTRLLAMYYEVTPRTALDEKFDISIALTNALATQYDSMSNDKSSEVRLIELSHLVRIGGYSPDMRWWHKPEMLKFSPFVMLVRLLARRPERGFTDSVNTLLVTIARDSGILQTHTKPNAVDALAVSLRLMDEQKSDLILRWLDDCSGRFIRKPVKYQDDLDSLKRSDAEGPSTELRPLSMLWMPLMEQWSFVCKLQPDDAPDAASWVVNFIQQCIRIGEDKNVLLRVCDVMLQGTDNRDCRTSFESILDKIRTSESFGTDDGAQYSDPGQPNLVHFNSEPNASQGELNKESAHLDELSKPPPEDEDHKGLTQWLHKDVDEAIADDDFANLVFCLCSKHTDVRLQALTNIRKLIARLETSSYTESQQLNLLLGELLETAENEVGTQPIYSHVAALTAQSAAVLADPLHSMYPKINTFLIKAPKWEITRLPSYWVDKILFNPPEDDGAYHKEVDWLLEFLFDGLRTLEDFEVLRVRGIFEHLLTLYSSPFSTMKVRNKVLSLLFRAIHVGASTSLITRSGIMAWIEAQISLRDGNHDVFKHLAARIYESCDAEKVDEWSHKAIKPVVNQILES